MTLPDLIERLTKAEGPSRELDWRIAEQFNIPEEWRVLPMWPPFMKGSKFDKAIPSFTASIDAAIAFKDSVLPETAIDHIGTDAVSSPNGYKTIGWTVELINGKRFQGQHQLLAIALVIAVLRALAEHKEAGR